MPPIIITGSFKGAPPVWFCLGFLLIGLLFLIAAILGFAPGFAGRLMWGLLGAILGGIGVALLHARREIHRSDSPESLARQFGVSERDLRDIIRERGIEPRYVVNGEPFFDPKAFGDPALLLRAIEKPAEDVLLRVPERQAGEAEHLLRTTHESVYGDVPEKADGGVPH
jgi:hypothetical protein